MNRVSVISNDIYNVISSPSYGFVISMFKDDGASTISPVEANWYYIKPINAMIQIPNEDDRNEIFFWKSIDLTGDDVIELLARIKGICNNFGYGFTISDFGGSNLPKQFSHLAIRMTQDVKEGYEGSAFKSYYMYENAKMVITHSSKVDETKRGARTRKVKSIFVECNNERRVFPVGSLSSAKAMVHHLGRGGSWDDNVGKYIQESVASLLSLKRLKRAAQEDADDKKLAIISRYIDQINHEMNSICSIRNYTDTAARIGKLPKFSTKNMDTYMGRRGFDPYDTDNQNFVKYDLYNRYNNLGDILDLIRNHSSLRGNSARSLAKGVCFGDHAIDIDALPSADTRDKTLLLCCKKIAEYMDDQNKLKPVFENIYSTGKVSPAVGKLVLSIINPPFVPNKAKCVGVYESARDLFNLSSASNCDKYKSRDTLVDMKIDDFLSLAEPINNPSQKTIDMLNSVLDSGGKISDVPLLVFKFDRDSGVAKVVGQEGRHRALALKSRGVDTMPVILNGNIRWSEQDDPSKFGYLDVWPQELVSEDGTSSIKFPVPREITVEAVDEYSKLVEWITKN